MRRCLNKAISQRAKVNRDDELNENEHKEHPRSCEFHVWLALEKHPQK